MINKNEQEIIAARIGIYVSSLLGKDADGAETFADIMCLVVELGDLDAPRIMARMDEALNSMQEEGERNAH